MKYVTVYLKNGKPKRVKVQNAVYDEIVRLHFDFDKLQEHYENRLKIQKERANNKFYGFAKYVYSEPVSTYKYGKNGKEITFKDKPSLRYNLKTGEFSSVGRFKR